MVDGIFDDVVAFSEIEQFIDTQVKFYSSGMVRASAFAWRSTSTPTSWWLDEVLAVGDEPLPPSALIGFEVPTRGPHNSAGHSQRRSGEGAL